MTISTFPVGSRPVPAPPLSLVLKGSLVALKSFFSQCLFLVILLCVGSAPDPECSGSVGLGSAEDGNGQDSMYLQREEEPAPL